MLDLWIISKLKLQCDNEGMQNLFLFFTKELPGKKKMSTLK